MSRRPKYRNSWNSQAIRKVPDGWYVVTNGKVLAGDRIWKWEVDPNKRSDGITEGSWEPPYNGSIGVPLKQVYTIVIRTAIPWSYDFELEGSY